MRERLITFGASLGCHQMPERSFSYKGVQFPMCARCTGVLIGRLMALILVFISVPKWEYLLLGCLVMFIDWELQYLKILESTNLRRLITGIIGGYSLLTLFFILVYTAFTHVRAYYLS